MSIAKEIFLQIGGNRMVVMTGAKNFVGSKNSLSFKLPSKFAKDEINYVKITLNSLDLYDIECGKLWGSKYKVIKTSENVYNTDLQKDFVELTGLKTRLF